jgi:outer membrane biosynthesis protein TonB
VSTVALVLGALVAVAAVVVVALPFLREPEPADDRLAELSPAERERLALAEARDQALAALKELELDHRTGKVNDEDYRALVGPLRRRAAETLRALDAYAAPMSETEPQTPEVPQPAIVPEPTPVPHQPVEPAVVPEPVPPPDEGDRPAQPDVPEPTPR